MLYFITSLKSDNFLLLHTSRSLILLNLRNKFLLSVLCIATPSTWQNCPLLSLFPADLPALREAALKQCEIQSWAWQPTSVKSADKCQLREKSRLSPEKDCLQSSVGFQRLMDRKQSVQGICKWLSEESHFLDNTQTEKEKVCGNAS